MPMRAYACTEEVKARARINGKTTQSMFHEKDSGDATLLVSFTPPAD